MSERREHGPAAAPGREREGGGGTPWHLQGGGIAGETARSVDWSRTPLGPPESWPSTLKATVATMFRARQPMFLWWGEELVQLYNDAYLPSFGEGKHPRAMGQAGRECWQEIWRIIAPQIEGVMERGVATLHEDALVPVHRNGRIEDAYWTYSYSPVFDAEGAVAGTLVICTETTRRVLGERRTQALHRLVGATTAGEDAAGLRAAALTVIAETATDIPFAVFCERDRSGDWVASAWAGVTAASAATLCEQAVAALPPAAASMPSLLALSDMAIELEPPGGSSIEQAYVGQLAGSQEEPRELVVLGVSPHLPLDDPHQRFFEQVVAHLREALTRAEEAARRATIEVERRNLLEQAPVATALMVGPEHVFEIANPRYRQMVGKPDIVGRRYLDAFPELRDTPLPGILNRVYEQGEPFCTQELRIPLDRGGGSTDRFFKFNLEPVRDAQGHVYGMMAVAIEITEQVQARMVSEQATREREQLLHELEQASRAKDEFLAMLGHELRNPLAPIVTALELLHDKANGSVPHEQRVIERHVRYLTRLVDDLLDVARVARGKVDLRLEPVDLHDVITEAAEVASDLLEEGEHRLSIECERGQLWCTADRLRLTQVVSNLLTNAAKYTEPGGNIAVRASAQANEVVVSVVDDGMGISAEMMPRLFTLFEQGARSSPGVQGGLGIGLALVKNLVELHGGTVRVHSEGEGSGSEFTVRLPAGRAAPVTSSSAPTPDGSRTARRVLVVDDNVDAASMLELRLQVAGHETAVAHDARSALKLAEGFVPEVAVLDIGLPVIDGHELARRLRRLSSCAECRLIALTGYGLEHDRQRSRESGFHTHLVKPVDMQVLLRAIEGSNVADAD